MPQATIQLHNHASKCYAEKTRSRSSPTTVAVATKVWRGTSKPSRFGRSRTQVSSVLRRPSELVTEGILISPIFACSFVVILTPFNYTKLNRCRAVTSGTTPNVPTGLAGTIISGGSGACTAWMLPPCCSHCQLSASPPHANLYSTCFAKARKNPDPSLTPETLTRFLQSRADF